MSLSHLVVNTIVVLSGLVVILFAFAVQFNIDLKKTVASKNLKISNLKRKNNEYKFVMRISDDISAEMQKEIESLTLERDTLKSKLNHKKRPTK